MEERKKFYDSSSYDVDRLSQEELKEAFHIWSHGSRVLEDLFWTSYDAGLKSTYSGPVNIGYLVRDENRDVLKDMCCYMHELPTATIRLSMSGNPYSGPNWYWPWIEFEDNLHLVREFWYAEESRNCADDFFADLINIIEGRRIIPPIKGGFARIFEFYEFFKNKLYTPMIIMSTEGYSYNLILQLVDYGDIVPYYINMFWTTPLRKYLKMEDEQDGDLVRLHFKCRSFFEFDYVIRECLKILKQKWTRTFPDEIPENAGFHETALILHRKWGTSPEGIAKMNDWLNEHRGKNHSLVNY